MAIFMKSKNKINFKNLIYGMLAIFWYKDGRKIQFGSIGVVFPIKYARYYPSNYQPDKQKFIEDYCTVGGASLDCGAHIGLYSVILSKFSESVISLEPTTTTYGVLLETLRMSDAMNVNAKNLAVSDISGFANFEVNSETISNANRIVESSSRSTTSVTTITIDDLNRRFDFIKMDIEGSEFEALKGAQKTLHWVKAMTLELHPKELIFRKKSVELTLNLLTPFHPVYFHEGVEVEAFSLYLFTECFEINILLNGTRKIENSRNIIDQAGTEIGS